MPKYRQLHVKIIDSFDFNEMPDDFTRVVWVMLPLILDSEGRGIYNAAWIKSKMFPLRSNFDIDKLVSALDWLVFRKMIVQYSFDGHEYFYIPTFKTYQKGTEKEAKSVLPSPPELGESNSGVGQELVSVAASASASASAIESALTEQRPEIFGMYEREIGPLTSMIAQELIEAERDYPPEYITIAFHEAAANNKRSWAYARAILKRMKVEGLQPNRKNGNGSSYNTMQGDGGVHV